MDFYIHNRYSAAIMAHDYRQDNTFAIISIIDSNSDLNNFHNSCPEERILRLQFDDIDKEVSGFKLFKKEDAEKILNFTKKQTGLVDFYIIHCEAGISRSAGVAAALSKIYNQTDEWVFKCKKYIPNMYVYRYILNEYYTDEKKYQ